MLLIFKKAISQCSNRYIKTNNKYIGKKIDKNKNSVFI